MIKVLSGALPSNVPPSREPRAVVNGSLSSARQVARIVRECLEEGKTVVIDGLGSFRPQGKRGYRFVGRAAPSVFLAYVREDTRTVERLCDALEAHGFDPWIDRRKLLPGQKLAAIHRRRHRGHRFCRRLLLATFGDQKRRISGRNPFCAGLRGGFRWMIYFSSQCAWTAAACRPLSGARFNMSILFPDWERGLRRIVTIIHRQLKRRPRKVAQGSAASVLI